MGFYSKHIFPRFCNWVMDNREHDEQRLATLAEVTGEALEIGFGTGLNLPHYPDTVKSLVTIDTNPGMARAASSRIASCPFPVESQLLSGESLPMEDDRFDSVVSTWTLCSIVQVENALAEINRVLRPGGRFFFVEHGLSPDKSVRRWQNRLNPIQKIFAEGCNLNRDIRRLVKVSGLSIERLHNEYMPKAPRFAGYLYRGIARKE